MRTLHPVRAARTLDNPRQEHLGTRRQFRLGRGNPPTEKSAEPTLQLAKVASVVNEVKNAPDYREIEKPIP
jgi:hypothetical protein